METEIKENDCAAIAEVVERIKKNDVYLIDVRNPSEMGVDGTAFIKATRRINIPLPDFENALQLDEDAFQSKYGLEKPKKDGSEVVIHCGTGRRSAMALKIMFDQQYTKAKHMPGGYNKWVEETKP